MDALAREYADQAHFLFVYTRSTHPEKFPEFPAHRTIEEKFEHARIMRDRWQTPRRILVDALDGDVHRLYGGAPNMSWIIDHTGRVAYKASWTSAHHLRPAIEYAVRALALKRDPQRIAFYQETVEWSMPVRSTLPRPVGAATGAPGRPA